MKLLLSLTLILVSQVAFADPLLTCNNSAGAQLSISQYADQPPEYSINSIVSYSLSQQGATSVPDSASGTAQRGPNFSFAAETDTGLLTVVPENYGFTIYFSEGGQESSANYHFWASECQNDSI